MTILRRPTRAILFLFLPLCAVSIPLSQAGIEEGSCESASSVVTPFVYSPRLTYRVGVTPQGNLLIHSGDFNLRIVGDGEVFPGGLVLFIDDEKFVVAVAERFVTFRIIDGTHAVAVSSNHASDHAGLFESFPWSKVQYAIIPESVAVVMGGDIFYVVSRTDSRGATRHVSYLKDGVTSAVRKVSTESIPSIGR